MSLATYLIDPKNAEDLQLLRTFYLKVLPAGLPDAEMRGKLKAAQEALDWSDKDPNHACECLILKANGVVVGGAIYDLWYQDGHAAIEYFIIDPEHQRKGHGAYLFEQVKARLSHLYPRREVPIFCESLLEDDAIRFWRKRGFRPLDLLYMQPGLDIGMEGTDLYYLMCYNPLTNITQATLRSFLFYYYRDCCQVAAPLTHPGYLAMLLEMSEWGSGVKFVEGI